MRIYVHIYRKYVHVVWGMCICVCVLYLAFILPYYLTVSLQLTHSEFILIINFSHIPYDVF